MAQIDMNKLNKNIGDSAEIKESDNAKQAQTDIEDGESTDNASVTTEDNSEITKETEDEADKTKPNDKTTDVCISNGIQEDSGKVVVTYVGGGIWKDVEGNLWASEKKSDSILSERQYTANEYETREDIKFMVNYGAMKAIHVK